MTKHCFFKYLFYLWTGLYSCLEESICLCVLLKLLFFLGMWKPMSWASRTPNLTRLVCFLKLYCIFSTVLSHNSAVTHRIFFYFILLLFFFWSETVCYKTNRAKKEQIHFCYYNVIAAEQGSKPPYIKLIIVCYIIVFPGCLEAGQCWTVGHPPHPSPRTSQRGSHHWWENCPHRMN